MRHFRLPRRHVLARAAALPVLLALGLGLTPAIAAHADDTPTSTAPADDTMSSSAPAEDTTVEAPAAPPSALDALAAARYASLGLDGGGIALDAETSEDVAAALDTVLAFVAAAIGDPDAVVPDDIDLAELEATVEEAVESLRGLAPDPKHIGALVQTVVETLVYLVTHELVPLVGDVVPTPADVQELAQAIQTFLTEQATMGADAAADAANALLTDLAPWVAYLTDERHQQTAKDAVTTLLISLGAVVNPVPATLAPTAEMTFNAAGALVAWSDALVQQQAHADSPWYDSEDTDSDEATDETTTVVDDDLIVAGEPVVVPGPMYLTRPAPPVDVPVDTGTVTTAAGYDCGMHRGETCLPPVKYGGGEVIHNPIVRVVLVGSWWSENSEGRNIAAGLASAFSNMSGSAYQGILRQYYSYKGHIGATVSYQGQHIIEGEPTGVLSNTRVGSYAVRAAKARPGWKTDNSVVWVVALPPDAVADAGPGREPNEKCGYQSHVTSGGRRYVIAEVDYPRSGCMYGVTTTRGAVTRTAVHEYVGAVTNPIGGGWYDQSATPQHLPDLCRAKVFDGTGGERMSMVWSNSAGRCVTGMTDHSYKYRITDIVRPPGESGGGYTPGHAYKGAVVRAVNTGTMPWLSAGAKKTYLGTADDACSPFTDSEAGSGWASCDRIYMALPDTEIAIVVWPGETATFTFKIRPDGTLLNAIAPAAQTFRLVAGTTWMTNTGSTSARIGGINILKFNAEVLGSVDRVGYVAAGTAGSDTTVRISLRNTGEATWYKGEALHIGTRPGTSSPYAAASWPAGPGGCRACRAARIDTTTPPGGVVTLTLTLRIPNTKEIGEATFYPLADVKRVADKSIASVWVQSAEIKISVVHLPGVLGTREVVGYGFADGGLHADNVASGTATNASTSGFSCAAVSNVDAVSTAVSSCTAQVTTTSGTTWSVAAPASEVSGAVALTSAAVDYDPNDGDRIVVCWSVATTFLDGSRATDTGCTT